MEISNLIPHIEALIFASDKPLTAPELTELINQAFGFMEDKIVPGQIDAALEGIVEKYNAEFYPFEVKQSGGGWQFLTKPDFHKTVAQLNGEKFLKRLSAAALETLAIVAYKQPVTKGEIESIRGVSSDYAVQKLLEKELIVITGRNEKMPGHPLVYATSRNFMDYFGINSPEDLPRIREVLADQVIEPTNMHLSEAEQNSVLAISGDGELVVAEGADIPEELPTDSADSDTTEDVSETGAYASETSNDAEETSGNALETGTDVEETEADVEDADADADNADANDDETDADVEETIGEETETESGSSQTGGYDSEAEDDDIQTEGNGYGKNGHAFEPGDEGTEDEDAGDEENDEDPEPKA